MKSILTCGHSSRSFDELTNLLSANEVTLLVDVRSKPVSRYCPHFNRAFLENRLPMEYLWMPDLGGLGFVSPDAFDEAICKLICFTKQYRVCVMCSEKDYLKCHRHTKLQPALEERGVKIIHI
jgi:uncharacterized protein (DUF488 family)